MPMIFERGNIVDVDAQDGITKFRGQVVYADAHKVVIHFENGMKDTYEQGSSGITLVANA